MDARFKNLQNEDEGLRPAGIGSSPGFRFSVYESGVAGFRMEDVCFLILGLGLRGSVPNSRNTWLEGWPEHVSHSLNS